MEWGPNGGHGNGRRLALTFAAVMLDDQGMQDAVSTAPYGTFSEDGSTYYSPVAKRTLYGQGGQASMYWYNQATDKGSRTVRDPYGYIDGGKTPGGSYQFCCNSSTWKGSALSAYLMPELRTVWNYEPFFDYVDRWVVFGAWTQPDPYAPLGDGAFDTDPSDGMGRYPSLQGSNRNGGYWGSTFSNDMWAHHRPQPTVPMPHVEPQGGSFGGPVTVTIESPHMSGVLIYYTTDGTEPTTSSSLYTGPFLLANTLTLRARGISQGSNDGAIASVDFVIAGTTPTPVVTPTPPAPAPTPAPVPTPTGTTSPAATPAPTPAGSTVPGSERRSSAGCSMGGEISQSGFPVWLCLFALLLLRRRCAAS